MTATQTAAASVHPAAGSASTSWFQRRLHAGIVFYQRVREGRPSPCRFFPSCSAYALESIDVHGTWRGGWLSVRRLLRCRPLGPSGFDPVPERSSPEAVSDNDTSRPAHSPELKGG